MTERKYSVSEIDTMRRAVEELCRTNMPYYPQDRVVEVEQRLRTYMTQGIDPDELWRAADEHIKRLCED